VSGRRQQAHWNRELLLLCNGSISKQISTPSPYLQTLYFVSIIISVFFRVSLLPLDNDRDVISSNTNLFLLLPLTQNGKRKEPKSNPVCCPTWNHHIYLAIAPIQHGGCSQGESNHQLFVVYGSMVESQLDLAHSLTTRFSRHLMLGDRSISDHRSNALNTISNYKPHIASRTNCVIGDPINIPPVASLVAAGWYWWWW